MLSKRYLIVAVLLALCAVFACLGLVWAAEPLPDPEQPGPYPVGVTTLLLLDASRPEESNKLPRPLMTEIWYPATDETRDIPKGGLIDTYLNTVPPMAFELLKSMLKVDLKAFDKTFQFFSVRDARVRAGSFPLVLFSHGSKAARIQNIYWCEQVASHGYIVVAPDHTGNSIVTFVDGSPVLANTKSMEELAPVRTQDLRFVIDWMTRANKGADSRFQGKVDLEHIAVAGHSFGGYNSLDMADKDPRVDAIIPIAGAAMGPRANYTCPVLDIIATEDKILKLDRVETMRKYYEESKGPRYLVEFLNCGHFSFTEIHQFVSNFGDGIGSGKRITNGEPITYTAPEIVLRLTKGYSTAFLGRYLKGLEGYDTYLRENHDPQEILFKWSVPDAKPASP